MLLDIRIHMRIDQMLGKKVMIYSAKTGKWREAILTEQILANHFSKHVCYQKIEIE